MFCDPPLKVTAFNVRSLATSATEFVTTPLYPLSSKIEPPLQVPTLSMVQFLTDVLSNTMASVVAGTVAPPSQLAALDQFPSAAALQVLVAVSHPTGPSLSVQRQPEPQ